MDCFQKFNESSNNLLGSPETLSSICSLVLCTQLLQTSNVQSRTPLEVIHTRGKAKEPCGSGL